MTPLLQEFRTVFGKYAPKDSVPSSATLQGYLSARVFVEALKASGGKPTARSFDKTLEALNVDLGDYVVRYGKNNRISHTATDIAIFRFDGRRMF